jgi:hypothetical protein
MKIPRALVSLRDLPLSLSSGQFRLLLCTVLVLFYNGPLWQLISEQPAASSQMRWLFMVAFFSFMVAVLQSCSEQEIRNAYDNSILYTDYFLSRVIGFTRLLASLLISMPPLPCTRALRSRLSMITDRIKGGTGQLQGASCSGAILACRSGWVFRRSSITLCSSAKGEGAQPLAGFSLAQRLDPAHQLGHGEGLDQVVIGALFSLSESTEGSVSCTLAAAL